MNQQEFEDTARRYREEMFRLYANQSMTPPPKPAPPMYQPQQPMPPMNQPQQPMPPMNQPQQPAPPMNQPQQPMPPMNQPQQPMPPMNQPQQPAPPMNQPQQPAPPMNQPQQPMPPMDLPTEQPPSPPEVHHGSVQVAVSTARGARPVAGATVSITREMNGKEHLYALQITDESGETGEILLPAPAPSENQQHPDYYAYDIHVYAPGYYREAGMQVPVFPNILSLQTFDLIPLPAGVTDLRVNGDLLFYNHMKNFETGGEAHAQR